MAKGGWVVKLTDTEIVQCHTISFHYDAWEYAVNNEDRKRLPDGISTIKIEIGEDRPR